MAYRTVKIDFSPSSTRQWAIYQQSRAEAACLWNDLLEHHFRIRRANWKWPAKGRWEKWAQGRYPHLHSQSVQQIIGEFLEAVESTRQLRKAGLCRCQVSVANAQPSRPSLHQSRSQDS